MKYRTLFFDLDNTLYDFMASSREAYREVYTMMDYGRYFDSFESYFAIYQKRNDELWTLYNHAQITKDQLNAERYLHPLQVAGVKDAEEISKRFFAEAMKVLPTKGILRPYAREILDYLRPRYPLFILSNGFVELQTRKMQSAGILGYFDGIVLSEDIGINKPNKALFDHALAVANAKAEDSLMIGDDFDVDIVGAKEAGWDQLFYQIKPLDTVPFSPTYTIHSLKEIEGIL